MNQAQETFILVLNQETLAGNCGWDRDFIRSFKSLQDAWAGGFPQEWNIRSEKDRLELRIWFVETFVSDRQAVKRIRRMLQKISGVFSDFSDFTKKPYPYKLVLNLQHAVLDAWCPSPEEVVGEATKGNALRAKILMQQHIGLEGWHKRS